MFPIQGKSDQSDRVSLCPDLSKSLKVVEEEMTISVYQNVLKIFASFSTFNHKRIKKEIKSSEFY